MAKTA